MKIYDLSKELFSAWVFPGDPVPSMRPAAVIGGDCPCNVTEITLGSHSGTHMDAPRHFYADGRTIDQLELEKCAGWCKVSAAEGKLTADWVAAVLADGTKRLLIKGDIEITLEAAKKMTEHGLWFLGVEGPTVGPMEESGTFPVSGPVPVHLELLGSEVVILESAVMTEVPEGNYLLASAPIKYGGIDGAQVRPLLLDLEAP